MRYLHIDFYKKYSNILSGVTRVGDTQGGNWGRHPSIFLKNLATFFAHRYHHHYRFLLLSLGCHPPRVCDPTPFLPVRPRFSTILCKFAHKIFFLRMSPPWRVSPGAVCPPSDATEVRNETDAFPDFLETETSRPRFHACITAGTCTSGLTDDNNFSTNYTSCYYRPIFAWGVRGGPGPYGQKFVWVWP